MPTNAELKLPRFGGQYTSIPLDSRALFLTVVARTNSISHRNSGGYGSRALGIVNPSRASLRLATKPGQLHKSNG